MKLGQVKFFNQKISDIGLSHHGYALKNQLEASGKEYFCWNSESKCYNIANQ